jgi:hypothetical protein
VGSFKLAEEGRAAAPAPARPAPAAADPVKHKPKVTALPRQEAKPAVADLPRKRPEGKAGTAKEEGWEEF